MLNVHPVTLCKWEGGGAAPGAWHRGVMEAMTVCDAGDSRQEMRRMVYSGRPLAALAVCLAGACKAGAFASAG
jgi:hypothetical protein